MAARLAQRYKDEIIPMLMKEFGHSSVMSVPRVTKIVVSMGIGKAQEDESIMTEATEALASITGQKAKICRAKAPIAGFHLREGSVVGAVVTLRRERMYEFLDRLITVAVPRIKDFRGLSMKSFDGRGNYNFGINEQIIFPEINTATLGHTLGMNITIVTANGTNEQSDKLLTAMGMPFARPEQN
jgi:large subunit ribosomal protein L5